MACVILPSETARLVYGYLVKENMNDIALQFLQTSPYLMDCCQIVKNGYQFNTKLMDKDLQELIQEYSIIHNLVNNKVSLLCKTSLLYKRIKLKCESISDILELMLFSKYKNSKNEENLCGNEKNEKNLSSQINTINYDYKNSDSFCNKINDIGANDSIHFNNNSDAVIMQNSDSIEPENFSSKLCSETYLSEKDSEGNQKNLQVEENVISYLGNEANKGRTSDLVPMQGHEIAKNNEITSSVNSSNLGNSGSCDPKLNSNSNILSIDVDSQNENALTSEIETNPLEETVSFENQIKIVRIEKETQNENQSLGVYSKPVAEGNGNMDLENSPVVFIGPEVGNVTINQDRNQIIVIPIDYYKSQDELQNAEEIENGQKQGITQEKGVIEQNKKNEAFEGGVISSNVSQFYNDINEKTGTVDDNIMTESDFLKNGHLMYNFAKELKRSDAPRVEPEPPSFQEPKEKVATIQPVSTPLIVFSQTVVPTKTSRYRAILPKEQEVPPVHPVVVVHPLLENNKDLQMAKKSTEVETKVRQEEPCRKFKKRVPLLKKSKSKRNWVSENLNMPAIKTPVQEKVIVESSTTEEEIQIASVGESVKQDVIQRASEEKENLEKKENKKIETPIFVTKRNSKRLSLSTPRRRSHIRALEFETPPKTKEEKKSRTSPKVKPEQSVVERKSIRNPKCTLFKSPIPEDSLKSPVNSKGNKQVAPETNSITQSLAEPLNELSIPIATRSPNTKLSDAWENLTGVGCVIGQNEEMKTSPTIKKMWDADLRCFIPEINPNVDLIEKKRIRKPEKTQKDTRKTTKKKPLATKKSKPMHLTVSPSKMSLTAKRNTYSINGNEEGSPVRPLLDDFKIVTPFKDIETIRPTEETPLTKLLRENINTIDIDLSMINTPSFPPTPSIVITPDLDDVSMSGANYYSPSKECSKDRVLKITDYFKVDAEKSNKKETKEMHDKVIYDLVSKAKEIIGIGRENQEESAMTRRPSGKILSMVKIQMLTQCDKKLCENIPINEETSFTSQTTLIGNLNEEAAKSNLKEELEEKKKRALRKIRVVKENLSQTKRRVTKRRKLRRSGYMTTSDKSKSDISNGTAIEKQTSESDESLRRNSVVFHSTPYAEKKPESFEKTDLNKVDDKTLNDIRQEFPPFKDNADKYPELTEKSRKKLHYVENFLKIEDVVNFLNEFNEKNSAKLFLKPSLRRFFQVFYKWLKHPHKRELNASSTTKALLQQYLLIFDKINKGLNPRNKKSKRDSAEETSGSFTLNSIPNATGNKVNISDGDERERRKKGNERKKEEDTEDGMVSTLPLKKRKSTVQQVEIKNILTTEKDDSRNCSLENVSQTQNFLQDIDVDRFLSQIHGQENR